MPTAFSYDMCLKAPTTRSKLYRSKSIKRQRKQMCSPGKMPRCVKGKAFCVKTPKGGKAKTSKSKTLLLK